MLDENVSPAADQPDPRAVGQPLVTLVTLQGQLSGNTEACMDMLRLQVIGMGLQFSDSTWESFNGILQLTSSRLASEPTQE
eukprot:1152867-Pelagomonas_calceolata.AAC.2